MAPKVTPNIGREHTVARPQQPPQAEVRTRAAPRIRPRTGPKQPELLRHSSSPPEAKTQAAQTLFNLADNNGANTVAIAAAVGLEALVQLARSGSVTVDNQSVVLASIAAKRKAALVVAALLRACVPEEVRGRADVQDVIRGVIGAYL